MHRFSTSILAITALLTLALAGCKPETLKIGVVLPLSGPNEAAGQAALEGLELALADLQAAGQDRFELVVRDSGGNAEQAQKTLEELYTQEKAVAAIGGLTPYEARALAEVAEAQEKILLLPTSGDQRLSEGSKHVYRISVSDAASGSKLAAFVRKGLPTETAMALTEDARFADTLIEGFQPTFENLQGQFIGHVDASGVEGGLQAAVGDTVAKAPGAVVLNGDGPWLGEAVSHLRSAGYKGKILAPQHFSSPSTLAFMGEDARGVLFAYSPIDRKQEVGVSFIERFEAANGKAPSLYAAEAFDSLLVLAKASTDRPAIASELRRGLRDEIKSFQGVTGSIEFDDTGATQKFPRVYSLSDELTLRDHEDLVAEIQEKRKQKIKELRAQLDSMGAR